jgi:hypothetical protein
MTLHTHERDDKSTGAVNGGFVWGCEEIGAEIGRTARQANHLLTTGQIQCAQKKGGRWVCNRAKLRAEFGA